MVSGHVDEIGEVIERDTVGRFNLFTIAVSKDIDRYLIEKGSVAVDGVSLTVNRCSKGRFSVAVIPHTAKITTMDIRKRGDKVNIEVDIIGKYIEKLLLSGRLKSDVQNDISMNFLAQHGFL